MWYAVDQVQGRYAILIPDVGQAVTLNRGAFREGQVYWWNGKKLVRSRAEERRRQADARGRLARLSRGDPGGDIIIP